MFGIMHFSEIFSVLAGCCEVSRLREAPRSKETSHWKMEKTVDDWLPVTGDRKAKWWYSTFHNVTAMVGAGVLGLPNAMVFLTWYDIHHLSCLLMCSNVLSGDVLIVVMKFTCAGVQA
jgi:hypothetical protein